MGALGFLRAASRGRQRGSERDVPERQRRRRIAISPPIATSAIVIAPSPSPARGPITAMIQPTSGPPIGVEPWKATNHRDITRPRISGSEFSCRVELPVDMNEMLAAPANASAISSTGSVGSDGRDRHRDRESRAASTSGRRPVLPRAATNRPPNDSADAHRGGHEAKAGRADVQPARGHHRQRHLELIRQAARDRHHQQRYRQLRRRADVAQPLAQLARRPRSRHGR